MAELSWGESNPYEAGVSHGVLYSQSAVAWNGLISVTENASGVQEIHYFDGQKVVVTQNTGDFDASIEAFTYPDEFEGYLKEDRYKRFGLSYRTQGSEGDKIHLVYNALVRKTSMGYTTIGNAPSPTTFRWDILASAIDIPGASPASHLVIDTAAFPSLMPTIEGWLYGTDTTFPRLPSPEELVDIFELAASLQITQNGDGTWTATGPGEVVQLNPDGSFHISAPSAFFIDEDRFTVQSL